jgi:predicted ATP-grasp superfamily ATP-dependent carboligase
MTEDLDASWQSSIDATTPAVILKLARDRLGHGPLGMARSLGRLGVAVHLVTPDAGTPAGYSHYVARSWVIPNNTDDESALRTLRTLSRQTGGRPVLIAADDLAALFVDRRLDELRSIFALPEQPAGLPVELSNKRLLHERCLELGIATPEARIPHSVAEAREAAAELDFPVVVKAADPRELGGTNGPASVTIVREAGRLEALLGHWDGRELPDLLFQEYIPGDSTSVWMFNGYFARDGSCPIGIVGQKIRQAPPRTGATSLGIVVDNKAVRDLSVTFLQRLRYRGIVDMGVRFDARDGRYKMLDVNPRIGASFRLFVGSEGLDVARALYLDLTGQSIPPATAEPGRRWWVEDRDTATALKLIRSGDLGIPSYFGSLRGVDETALLARDDLRPVAALMQAKAANLLRGILRR